MGIRAGSTHEVDGRVVVSCRLSVVRLGREGHTELLNCAMQPDNGQRTTMETSSLRSFTELKAWQKCRVLRKSISALVKGFPAEEKFRLTDQIIRSSRGPCSNISEGYGRFREKDNARFCRMARGSLLETQDHLSVAYDEKFITKDSLKEHWAIAEEALRVLNGYLRYLRKFEPPSNSVSDPTEPYGTDDDIYTALPDDL